MATASPGHRAGDGKARLAELLARLASPGAALRARAHRPHHVRLLHLLVECNDLYR